MHSTTNRFDSVNTTDFYPSRDVPESLRQYLIATENPQEIYLDRVHASERRLRLLHRRFLNQIAYGCRNPRCDVPTCFSYRKRVSGAAIRPYTDVSARALATRCVERYASHGREIGRGSRREHGKTKITPGSVNENVYEDGLCRNEPVIPWYADPEEYLAKIRAASSRHGRPQRCSAPRRQSTKQDQPGLDNNGHLPAPQAVKPNQETRPKQRFEPEALNHAQQETSTDNLANLDERATSSQEIIAPAPNDGGSDLPETACGLRATCPHKSRKDHASFVQSLFSKSQLRALDRPLDEMPAVNEVRSTNHNANSQNRVVSEQQPSPRSTPHSHPSTPAEWHQGEEHHQKSSATGGRPQQPQMTNSGTIRSAYTFRLLPPSAILWLRNTLIRRNEQSEPSAQESAPLIELERFIEQSLFYVLSDARRLMSSASTWEDLVKFRNTEDAMDVQLGLAQTVIRYSPRNAKADQAVEAFTGRKCTANNIAGTFGATHLHWTSVLRICADLVQFAPGDQGQPRIMHYMVQAIEQGFIVPSWMSQLKTPIPATAKGTPFLTNDELAHLITLVLNMAATMLYVVPDLDAIENKRSPREAPSVSLDRRHLPMETNRRTFSRSTLSDVDPSRDPAKTVSVGFTTRFWPYDHDFSELFTAIANLISFRIALDAARKTQRKQPRRTTPDTDIVTAMSRLLRSPGVDHSEAGMQLLEFMLAVLFVKWDRRPIIQRAGPVGGALEMLKGLYQVREELGVGDEGFILDFLDDTLDEFEMPYEWLSFKPDAIYMHILQFSFLFPPAVLVRYFRSLNFKIMKHSHEKALEVYTNATTQMIHARWPQPKGMDEVLEKARPHMARYFVMTIRREYVLEDAIGQIWRRERQEFTRPLRVRLGQEDGEEGLDHGGVQQEFFRLIFAEAFDARYGMFTTDPTTRMTWFQPGSLEPSYKFEALGILMSLAVFNGVTIPITMPLAFYRKVLGLKVKKIKHIADGWAELANSFEQLLAWDEGDVGDVIGRTYEFTYEVFGTRMSIDMSMKSALRPSESDKTRPPNSPPESQKKAGDLTHRTKCLGKFASVEIDEIVKANASSSTGNSSSSEAGEEAPLVTNDNRDDFVKDYIKHLTDITIAPQFTAFLRGLHTLLSPRSLALFTPPVLKSLVEGLPTTQPLKIDQWKATTDLDGFLPTDPFISWFWDILANDFSQSQLRALLAFVTASDRIPVGGWNGVIFIIQRNGDEDGRLPTSQTCYGRLLLPEYSSREVLKGRLQWAIDNSWGFWMA